MLVYVYILVLARKSLENAGAACLYTLHTKSLLSRCIFVFLERSRRAGKFTVNRGSYPVYSRNRANIVILSYSSIQQYIKREACIQTAVYEYHMPSVSSDADSFIPIPFSERGRPMESSYSPLNPSDDGDDG